MKEEVTCKDNRINKIAIIRHFVGVQYIPINEHF